jgi:hypothetical protein
MPVLMIGQVAYFGRFLIDVNCVIRFINVKMSTNLCGPRCVRRVELIVHCTLQENVSMMSEYLPLENFKQIYVVDLCKSLCEQAKKKVDAKGWNNVTVVEGDACTFAPPSGEKVTLVTFSYSLSSMRPLSPLK